MALLSVVKHLPTSAANVLQQNNAFFIVYFDWEIGLSLTSDYLWPQEFGLSLTIPKSAKSELDYLWPLVKDNPNSGSHRYSDSFSKFILSIENLRPFNRYVHCAQHAEAMVHTYFKYLYL